MKKRVLSFILVLLMLFGMMPMTLLTAFADSGEESEDDPDTPNIIIEPVDKRTGQYSTTPYQPISAKPDASGYAHFEIKVKDDVKLTENVTVSYKTVNLSAIAETGDYVAQSGTVVLTPEKPVAKISVKTERTEYSVETEYSYYDTVKASTYDSRTFKILITDVSDGAEIDKEKGSALCSLNAQYNLLAMAYGEEAYYDRKLPTFIPYTSAATSYGGKLVLSNVLNTQAWSDEDTPYVTSVPVNFPTQWRDYLDSAIGADLYMSIKDAHVDESSWNSSSRILVTVGGVTVVVKGEFHDNEFFGWGPALAYIIGGDSGEGNEYESYYNDNFLDIFWNPDNTGEKVLSGFAITVDSNSEKLLTKKDIERAMERQLIIAREYRGFGTLDGKADPEDYWLKVYDGADGVLGQSKIEISLATEGGYSRKLTGGTVAYRLEDLRAPSVEKVGNAYSVYHNFDTAVEGEKLRIALRFNEPVQVNDKMPYLTGKVNGRGTGAITDPYCMQFKYAGGSGTDTLYFEADYNGNYLITSLTDITFANGKYITDYASIANSFSASGFSLNLSGFSLDRRTPVISVDNDDFNFNGNSDIIRSTSIDVTVSQISDGAILYYSWTDSNTISESFSYDNVKILDDISIHETQTVTITGGGDGKKYLHIKVVSSYGKYSTYILNNLTGVSAICLGGYNFDNSAPTFGKTVIPLGESDLSKKIYEIPLPTDNPSSLNAGFEKVKMYFVKPDGKEFVFEFGEKAFDKTDSNGRKYLRFELTAEMLEIGEKTRVEDITVYFVLSDKIGNVATNVSRHTVTFDTNEYVNVTSSGSTSDFSSRTETINGEKTFIYSNDKTVTIGEGAEKYDVYYAFEFKIKEEATDCTNIFKLTKISENDKISVLIEDGNDEDGYNIRTVSSIEPGVKTVILEFTSPIESGWYEIQLLCYDQGNSTSGKADRVSDSNTVYIGTGEGLLGDKINAGTLLINKVYQLPAMSSFYYMSRSDDENNPGSADSVLTEYYNKDKLSMSFSSADQARKYILFNEYRDLYAITISEALAEALNSKTSGAQPAQGEKTVAIAGQVWIRYKSISWTVGSKQTSNWVYYYYGSSETLNPDNFSPILNEALNYVTDVILKTGKLVSLTDLSLKNNTSSSLLDKNGVPYLAPSQIVSTDLKLSDSATKISNFSKEITYAKDTAIYSSGIIKNDLGMLREFTLIGNVDIPTGSRFQYRKYKSIGSGYVSEMWVDIELVDGKALKFCDVITSDGWYEIRELGADGVTLYDVYIDKKAPSICVSWNNKDGYSSSLWLTDESENEFRAGSFEITSTVDDQEVDKYSYVAIYTMVTSELYGMYTLNELKSASVQLPDGKYYMIVADRSGNSYYLSLYINSTSLNCSIEKTDNVRIRFLCDRDPSQIQTFYVKRNGVRVENVQYATMIPFTESGTYEFYIEDIYGNSETLTEVFLRDYPELDWSYLSSGGYFEKYNKDDPEASQNSFKLKQTSDGVYEIISSAQLRFHLTGDYVFSFIGSAPDVTVSDIYGHVTINSTQSFQLKVAYRDHPDVYTVYYCMADRTAPSISVSARVDDSIPAELDLLRKEIEAGNIVGINGTIVQNGETVNGKLLTPSTIAYLASKRQTKYLVDGETILSDFIKVTASDENALFLKLQVYLGGELIKQQTSDAGYSEIILSRYGEYRIVAEDALGNVSEFFFKNESPDAFEYRVDGKLMELGLHDYQNFDQNFNYTALNYGNSSVSFTIFESMNVFYMITDTDGEKMFVAFDVRDGVVRSLHYFLRDGSASPELVSDTVLFDSKDKKFSKDTEYAIYEKNGVLVLAKIDSNGNITLTVYAKDDGVMTVEARLTTVDGEFYYNKTELSNVPFDIIFKSDNEFLPPASSDGQMNLNKNFEISTDNFGENIASVEVYFSRFNDLNPDNLSGKENIYGKGEYSEEGFYLVIAEDKYGNKNIYRIHLSNDFDVTAYVEYSYPNGHKVHYSTSYNKTLYSNFRIVFELHSNNVEVLATKDGKKFVPTVVLTDGVAYVILDEEGYYTLTLSDEYGNTYDHTAEINNAAITFNEDLLSGYNENALKRDEGYTNKKLTVMEDELVGISYLAILYGNDLKVIYDAISEEAIELVSSALYECVGRSGDGEYTVVVRNKYGAIATKKIYYRETPTLKLEREIRSSVKPEPYSIEDAQSIGFWSNSILYFTTDAAEYVFTINGDKTDCPNTISFATSGQYGRSEYDITYVDEYGFSYSFKAYLVRQDLEIKLPSDLIVQKVNDIITTKDSVSVEFSDNAFCTYTINNSEPKTYNRGDKLTMDGVYRFTVSDYAGNASALTIKKDTIVEFYFKSNKSSSLQSGEIVNYSNVEFCVDNNDSAYIERVLRNGEIQNNFEGTIFAEDGKWEVILADKLGNRAYFSFYIISREQNGFSYTTPYEYHIKELWFDLGDGVKVSYMNFVTHTEFTSNFEFTENGKYTVLMASDVSGQTSTFEFTVNTTAPNVSLVGCNVGETTINDVTITGCKVGDRVKIYKITDMGDKLVDEVHISSLSTQIPTITEGGKYRIVVESEAGVSTELSFVRKHVMNTSGSIFIMIMVGIAAAGLFAGLVYRNKSKTDD